MIQRSIPPEQDNLYELKMFTLILHSLNFQVMQPPNQPPKAMRKPIIPITIDFNRTQSNKSIDFMLDTTSRAKKAYEQYLRLLNENRLIEATLKHVLRQKREMEQRLRSLTSDMSEMDDKKRRHRRNAGEIVRKWVCQASNCDKSYGSEGSLIQHTKLKHYEFYNSDQYHRKMKQLASKI